MGVPDRLRKLEGTWEGEHKVYDIRSGSELYSYRTVVQMGVRGARCSNRITNTFGNGKQVVLEFGSRVHGGTLHFESDKLRGKCTAIDGDTIVLSGATKGEPSSFHEIVRYVADGERVVTSQLFDGGAPKAVRVCFQTRTSPDGGYFDVWYDGWPQPGAAGSAQ